MRYKVSIKDYEKIIGRAKVNKIKKEAKALKGIHVAHVNSTYNGGGVAEMLNTIVLLLNDLGLLCGWRLLKGSPPFFDITKSFHNGMQGAPIKLGKEQKDLYEGVNFQNSIFTHIEKHDVVVIHDPQPLPYIKFFKKSQPWIWRCHIDITDSNPKLWKYLGGFVKKYDHMIVSDTKYMKKDVKTSQSIIHPSIDPLNDKNRDLDKREVRKLLKKMEVPQDKPIVTQISRYDPWKDPVGVLEIFKLLKKKVDCRLVLLGNVADDDPESIVIYEQVMRAAKGLKDVHLLVNVENNDLSVNALQRASDVILQKSTREGFGITVSEALWKKTPVIASDVGGIPLQIVDGKNGYLVQPKDYQDCADKILHLLSHDGLRNEMGEQGHKFVKENFLVTRHVLDYLKLFKEVLKKG